MLAPVRLAPSPPFGGEGWGEGSGFDGDPVTLVSPPDGGEGKRIGRVF